MEEILWACLTAARSVCFAGRLTWWSGGSVAWWRRSCGRELVVGVLCSSLASGMRRARGL